MERYRNYGQRRSFLMFVVIGILIFIFVYFPFFATNLRYTVGSLLRKIFDSMGIICIVDGVLFLSLGLFELYSHGHIWIKKVLVGEMLLYVVSWLTGLTLSVASGITERTYGGYH